MKENIFPLASNNIKLSTMLDQNRIANPNLKQDDDRLLTVPRTITIDSMVELDKYELRSCRRSLLNSYI